MTDLRLYEPGNPHVDLEITRWWLQMQADGDLEHLFVQEARTLGSLFGTISPPRTCLLAHDAEGIWFAAWFEPCMAGAFMGAWCRRRLRHSRPALQAFFDAWSWALAPGRWPLIVGVTKQPALLSEHRRLGYAVYGADRMGIGPLFDGEPTWMLVLTREAHERTLRRFQWLRRPAFARA